MKILLFLHELAVGGATVNAIELAASLRDRHGHDVVAFASPGPMLSVAQEAGLRVLLAPQAYRHPCADRMRALRAAVHAERPDLVYVWETWPLVDAYLAVHLPMRQPMLVTDMQMSVARLLPRWIPITFGTPELVATARAAGVRRVDLLLPPVDLQVNWPDAVDRGLARQRCGIGNEEIALVIVSRLAHAMKGEGLTRAIDAMDKLGADPRLRLLIVGEGPARRELQRRADSAVDASA